MKGIDMKIRSKDARRRAQKIRLVIFDVDGVMTDGRITIDDKKRESKSFDVRDGHGVKMLIRTGVKTAIVTGRSSKVVRHRAKELGIHHVHQGAVGKSEIVRLLLSETGIGPQEAAFMGDDLVDIPAMKAVGLAVAPSDAVPEVIAFAHIVTGRPGGYGAVRELCEFIMKAQGLWEEATRAYK
jgi:3-deoxy-D-manno-octulosonate 8-phosphate phosphatase (KDO 8-P phosphatase)